MSQVEELHRSYLFVPGSNLKLMDKSLDIPADVLVFDLEDAILPDEKPRARQLVADALNAPEFSTRNKVVRINGISTPWFSDDLKIILESNPVDIMLPKCESAEDIRLVTEFIKQTDISLFELIESARGVFNLAEIVEALVSSDSSGSVCFGHVDFATDMALQNPDASKGAIYHARCQIALASRACGFTAIDNICLDVCNEQVIREDTTLGMQLGYDGKLCIHPLQVDIVNEVYTPTAEQVSQAKAILTAWEEVKQQDLGVFMYENRMIDLPVIHAQEHILRRAEAASLSHNNKNPIEE